MQSYLLYSASIFGLLISPITVAEEAADLQDIEEFVVVSKQLSMEKMNAVKTPTPILDVPQSLSIIDNSQIKNQSFNNFGDVLRYTPGLSISQGEGHRDAIIIRGIQTTADFFLDGFRDDVQYYRPLYNLEQIEILRGSNALLFGRGGGGGIVNRVTKKANLDENFQDLNASVDSFGAFTVAGDINRGLSDQFGLRINAFYEDMKNHRDFFGGQRFAINPTVLFQASPDTDIVFSYEYLDDDRTVDRGVPSQIVADGPNVPLKGYMDTFFGSAEQNYTTLQANILRSKVDHSVSENIRVNFGLQYADYDKVYQNLYASKPVDVSSGAVTEIELDGYRDTTGRENILIQSNLIGELDVAGFNHTLLVGAEYALQDTANARFDNVFADNGDDQLVMPFSDPLSIPDFAFTKAARDRASDVTVFSAYLQDQVDLNEWLQVVAGIRYDRFDIDVNDVRADAQFTRVDEEITPRFGAIFKPQENISTYISYSETFLPRSGDQFLTLNLDSESTKPQQFKNTELGLKWDVRDDLSITTAIFNLDRESYTSVDPEDPSQVIVIEGSKTKGFEVQLIGELADNWFITTGYSYLDGKVNRVDDGGFNGNKTRQTPENMFSIWNMVAVTDQLSFGLGATYQDSFFVSEDNSVEVPDYIRFDAAAYYKFNDQIRLQVNVENMLDANYFPDAHSNTNITTGKPFNVRFSVKTSF